MNLNLYKLFSEDGKKTYYTISKLKSNYVLNLFTCYFNHRKELNHPYYQIIKVPHQIEFLEEFEDRIIAKDTMNKLIKDDPNCINILNDEKKQIVKDKKHIVKDKKPKEPKEKKIKVRKTDDPEYNKKYYESNKDRLKGYYSEHLAKCREYNKKRYYDTKQKLQRLKELEGELNKNV